MEIFVARDFSDAPGARHKKDSKFSGEEFLEKLLLPRYLEAIEKNIPLHINLNHCFGFPPSFLDGSFAQLVRETRHSYLMIRTRIKFISDKPELVNKILLLIKEECENQERY